MNIFIFNELFLHKRVNEMRLIWVHRPSSRELKACCFQLAPRCPFYHELASNFIPSLFPINTSIED